MARRRKFFKTVIVLEVLSEDSHPDENWELEHIVREITNGDMVGEASMSTRAITGREMAITCKRMQSDPAFFQLDDRGKTVNG